MKSKLFSIKFLLTLLLSFFILFIYCQYDCSAFEDYYDDTNNAFNVEEEDYNIYSKIIITDPILEAQIEDLYNDYCTCCDCDIEDYCDQ